MIQLSDQDQIKGIQILLGVTADGAWGPNTQAALDALVAPPEAPAGVEHATYASSFADPADVDAFYKCKGQGKSDEECFKVGDNGIGCWGDSTVEGTGPCCALPPETMERKWGSVAAAKHKPVKVAHENGREVVCILKDRMPHLENLGNAAHIDLNPDACDALGLQPPVMEKVVWSWA